MTPLQVHQFYCRSDNYGVLVHDEESGQTVSIDAPDEAAIVVALDSTGWNLSEIFTTHHHLDHVEGNDGLKSAYKCKITGPKDEADKISLLDATVEHRQAISFAGRRVEVIGTPGHTLGEISYYFPDDAMVFTGDCLFALGCGRIFEGTPEMMWQSLQRLAALPRDTKVYCGHEYTLANARFAITIDPDNVALQQRMAEIEKLRADDLPTLPSTIGLELDTNPFLRASDPAIRAGLNMADASDAEVFAEIRKRKDQA